MRAGSFRAIAYGLIGAAALAGSVSAQTPSPSVPTPSTPGPNPGAAATDAIINPTKPATVEGAPAAGNPTPPAPPAAPSSAPSPVPPGPPTASGPVAPASDMRDLVEAARATAKSTREAVEYGRVVPDLLTQVLAKLDKIEDKLDKVENAVKAQRARR
jgi:hypothetical protein